MAVAEKNGRYYYWLFIEFVKKHNKLIFLSFLVSTISIISIITISPYLSSVLVRTRKSIGVVGSYPETSFSNLPDEILNKVSSGLTTVNNKGAILPLLASTWTSSKDGKIYTVKLRKNILLNNGVLFTTKDINYSFKDVTTKIIDEYTIQFILKDKLGTFPLYLTKPIIVYPYVGVAGLYSVQKVRVKNGRIEEIQLSPNRKDVQPITYLFFQNEGEMITAYKRAKITEMTISNKTMSNAFSYWKNTIVTRKVDYEKLLVLLFHFKNELFKERDFRVAIASAFPYKELSEYGELASSSIPPVSWGYNPDIERSSADFEFSQKTFKRLISASDSAKFIMATYYDYIDIADMLSTSLRDAGLNVAVDIVSYSPSKTTFDFFLAYLNIPQDPDQYYYWHSTQNLADLIEYRNLKVDKLLEDARTTYDITTRKEVYIEMQRALSDDPPAVFLIYPYTYKIERR